MFNYIFSNGFMAGFIMGSIFMSIVFIGMNLKSLNSARK